MTILGTFDLVRENLDPERFFRESDTLLFADGRISNRVGSGANQVVIDTAPKLTVLEVRVRRKDGEVLASEVAVGYAGASALVALSVLSFAGHVLKKLTGEALPSVDQVATFFGEAFKVSLHEYSQNILKPLNMSVVLCMYDVVIRKSQRRQVSVVWRDGKYHVDVAEPESSLSFLSGPDVESLERTIRSKMADVDRCVDAEYLIVREVELHARAHSDGKPFGGQLQICRIGEFGIKLATTRFWDFSHRGPDLDDGWSGGDYRTLLLGYDVFDLRVGQCDFRSDCIFSLPDSDKTLWAKETLKSEPRDSDDGDFFSRPRRGVWGFPKN